MALLNTFSLTEIITFIVLGAAAMKGVLSFIDWLQDYVSDKVHHKDTRESLKKSVSDIQVKIDKFETELNLLRQSDICSFKSYIVDQYNYFSKQGWIDMYSLEAIEERYKIYQLEGGNSFVPQLIENIRELPREPLKADD